MVSSNECDGDAEETGPAGEAILVVVLVAEDVIDSTQSGDRSGKRERAKPHAADIHSAVFSRIRLKANCPKIVPVARTKQEKPDGHRGENRHDYREIRGGAVECRNELVEPRNRSRMNFRR